jgi:L-threonylcarbamoyladenylate synthase
VYGLGCDPMRRDAISRIYALKGRAAHKPLSLHLASVGEAVEYAGDEPAVVSAFRRLLPGPVTLIVRRPAFIDEQMTSGFTTMGLRVPDHPLCSAILDRVGPVAGTSANLSGDPDFCGLGGEDRLPPSDLMIDAGPTPLCAPSTIVDLSAGRPRLVREGAMTLAMLEAVLGHIERPYHP